MKLGIMQPYFFPYLGYFDIINSVDQWVVFDTVQYIRHGWVNRNRILHPHAGWQYVLVPVKKMPRETAIKDIQIAGDPDWRRALVAQLEHYKKQAPGFRDTVALVEQCIAGCRPEESISALNVTVLARLCEYLGIHFDYQVFSQMKMNLGTVEGPGDWALRIAQEMGASEYVNPPGGTELFDREKYQRGGVRLRIKPLIDFKYPTGRYQFEPLLSIIDILMWNSPAQIKAYLDEVRDR
jgi:hypothetical protein